MHILLTWERISEYEYSSWIIQGEEEEIEEGGGGGGEKAKKKGKTEEYRQHKAH